MREIVSHLVGGMVCVLQSLRAEVVGGYGCKGLWFGEWGGYARRGGENWVERGSKWWKIKGVSGLLRCEAVR